MTKPGIYLLLFLATMPAASRAEDFCGRGNTNQLVWNEHFERTLGEFFDGSRASLFFEEASIAEQVLTGLGGPPEKLKSLSDGYMLASACRADSCTEKAAVVLSCPDIVEAVGVIHYTCQDSVNWQVCTDAPVLTIYRRKHSASPIATDALRAWAINALPQALLPLTYDYRDRHAEPMAPPARPGVGVLR